MDRSFNAFRPLWAAMLAMGLFISSGVYPVAAQNTDELEVSQPSVQSSSSTVGAETSVGPPPLPVTPEHATPPPLPTFYIAEGGQPVGPLNMGELQQKVAAGTLTSSTLVWRDGMENWSPAQEVKELASLFASADSTESSEQIAEEAAEFDARTFLLGNWQTRGKVPIQGVGMTDADLRANYQEDGTATVEGTITADFGRPKPIAVTLRSTGTWSVENISESRFFLSATMTTTGSAPGVDLSGLQETDSTAGMVQVLGPDSLRDSEGVTWSRVR